MNRQKKTWGGAAQFSMALWLRHLCWTVLLVLEKGFSASLALFGGNQLLQLYIINGFKHFSSAGCGCWFHEVFGLSSRVSSVS